MQSSLVHQCNFEEGGQVNLQRSQLQLVHSVSLRAEVAGKFYPFISFQYDDTDGLYEVFILDGSPMAESLKEKYFKIREQYWVQKHSWEKEDIDFFDEGYSTYLVIVLNGEVVGGCRAIHSNLLPVNCRLPVEDVVNNIPSGSIELSRFCIDIKGRSKLVRDRLLKIISIAVMHWSFSEGYKEVYAVIYECLRKRLSSFVVMETLTDTVVSHGKNTFRAVKIDCAASYHAELDYI